MGKGKVKMMSSQNGYDLAAKKYDQKNSYLNSFEKNYLFDALGEITGKKVLDVGAGTGRLSVELYKKGGMVTALDISEKMLNELNKKNKNIATIAADAENMPFNENSFDIVCAAFLIVHLKNPIVFFDEVYRVLKNDGLMIVTNINQKDPPKVKTDEGDIIVESYYHRPEKIIDMIKSLAFNVEKEIFVREKGVWINQIIIAKK